VTKKRHVTYSGELAKPMPAQPKFGLLATQEQINLATDAHKAEFFRRMMLLCDHYEIEAGNWIMLACLLARDHVPGLQTMRDRPGPKMKWGPYTAARAKLAIEYVTTTHSCTQLDAAKRLFRRTIWAKQSPSAPSLLRRVFRPGAARATSAERSSTRCLQTCAREH
jgi:hypothetical protein